MSNPVQQDRFVRLIDEHRKILYKVARCYAWNPADREELVQEMTLQLWRSFNRYDERYRFSTWMYRIALNVVISFVRTEARRTRSIVPADDSISTVLERAAEPEPAHDDLRLLDEFIQKLDELDRALVLLYLDGHRHDTIAEILGISVTNVGTRKSAGSSRGSGATGPALTDAGDSNGTRRPQEPLGRAGHEAERWPEAQRAPPSRVWPRQDGNGPRTALAPPPRRTRPRLRGHGVAGLVQLDARRGAALPGPGRCAPHRRDRAASRRSPPARGPEEDRSRRAGRDNPEEAEVAPGRAPSPWG